MVKLADTWQSHGMITTYLVQRHFRFKLISRLESASVLLKRNFRMSGGPNSNPLNGSLPPDWNRIPSMNNTYQPSQYCSINPFPNNGRRSANAFGYIANQQNLYGNNQQQYDLPATYMWNNQMQYQQNMQNSYQEQQNMQNSIQQQQNMQNSLLQQQQNVQNSLQQQQNVQNSLQQYFTNPYSVEQQTYAQQQAANYNDFADFMSTQNYQVQNYPTLNDRLSLLENEITTNFGQPNPNNFGSALNSFVQDMMFVSPPTTQLTTLPTLPRPLVTTLYQSNLLKELNLANKVSPIAEIPEPIEPGEFDINQFLTPSEKELLKYDVGKTRKFKLTEEEEAFKLDESVSQHKHDSTKVHRKWQALRPPSNSDRSFHFSILNYNVLAQDLLEMHPELYYKNDQWALNWNVRWRNLQDEFQKYNCDIVCLQEVQESHKELFDAKFKSLGYGGVYKKRTGTKTDGCSIYYRENMFKLVEFITVEYNQPSVDLLDRDNVAIIAKFVAKGNEQELIVANTHLLFNPRRQDIRLVQTQLLLTEIERMAFKPNMDRYLCEYHPVIVVGDFNSTPDSSVVEFIKSGYLNYEHLNKRTLSKENVTTTTGKVLIPPFLKITDSCQHYDIDIVHDNTISREEQLVKLPLYHSELKKHQTNSVENDDNKSKQFATGTLRHKFNFQSVYTHGTFENPEGTTNQGEWITTDYIFFNRSSGMRGKDWKLNLISRCTLPTQYDLRDVAIPNNQLGSDHLSLVAKFSLKTPRK